MLDHGRQVYVGPPVEARKYFENLGYKALPRQSTADYLTGCTDPNERQFAPGRTAIDVPSSPEALESAFLTSPLARTMEDELAKYKLLMEAEKRDQEAFRAAVLDDKKRGVSKKSPYTVGFMAQVKALALRQFQMRLQDRFSLITSFSLSIVRRLPTVLLSQRLTVSYYRFWLLLLARPTSTNPSQLQAHSREVPFFSLRCCQVLLILSER